MTAHIMQHEQQAWPMARWVSPSAQSCGGSTWSKRVASAMDSESWEERAFAEDASSSGQWPPRSYSCSFCQREFRTAQALGGHMNVHRRERAHANQLASLRIAAARLSSAASRAPSHTVGFLSPKSQMSTSVSGSVLANTPSTPLSSSPPSQESISPSSTAMKQELGTKPLLQSIPDILSETLGQQNASISWAPSRGGAAYHPYEKSGSRCKPGSQARFSFCSNKVMGEHEDTLDLELRLGRSSCAV